MPGKSRHHASSRADGRVWFLTLFFLYHNLAPVELVSLSLPSFSPTRHSLLPLINIPVTYRETFLLIIHQLVHILGIIRTTKLNAEIIPPTRRHSPLRPGPS
jgi:hypothetical protein